MVVEYHLHAAVRQREHDAVLGAQPLAHIQRQRRRRGGGGGGSRQASSSTGSGMRACGFFCCLCWLLLLLLFVLALVQVLAEVLEQRDFLVQLVRVLRE